MRFVRAISIFCLLFSSELIHGKVHIVHEGIGLEFADSAVLKYVRLKNMTNSKGERTFGSEMELMEDMDNLDILIAPHVIRPNGKLVPTPVTLRQNICDAFKKNLVGLQNVFEKSNLTYCPLKKGAYWLSDYIPDESKIPTSPPGRYRLNFKVMYNKKPISEFFWVGSVQMA